MTNTLSQLPPPPLYALLVRGSRSVVFDVSEQLGFETEMPALAISIFEDGPDMMYVQALFGTEDQARACVDQLNLGMLEYTISQLPDEDWTAKSQAELPPVHAGRFFVYGRHDNDKIPAGTLHPIQIDAGMAFGTGHHGTTKGCLLAFEALLVSPRKTTANHHWPVTVLDLGCGSGVLAIAAAKALNVTVLASDIDADAVSVTKQNARINQISKSINVVQADGVPKNQAFDLIFANILAAPLIGLASTISDALTLGGHVILSGLLDGQAVDVMNSYQGQGLKMVRRASTEGWSTLTMARLHEV